jgi:C-terminal processing protease CtpA/Prc
MKYELIFWLIVFVTLTSSLYSQELTKKEIADITEKIPKLISENYVLKDKRDEITTEFTKRVRLKKYLSITHPDSLARILTKDLREISNDKHLYVKHYKTDKRKEEVDWDAWEIEERILEKKQNFGFTEVKILQDNIGYIKIVEFMHPQRGMPTAVAAMKLVENTNGLIVDIRGNGGGYGGLMNYVLNHYFDGGPTHISTTIYSDENILPNKEYSSDLVYGKLRIDTPLFIITNGKTGSAAEFFAYTLQSFGKAKIVGQSTTGAAHMNSFYPLSDNFRMSISTGAPINPKTNTNWENTGVIPDHIVLENEIEKALELILKEVNTVANEK